MMLKSMTGFGRGESETGLGRITVEIRSVNHRYSDISIKLPRRLTPFENRIKEMVRSEVSRGRIDVSVKLESQGEGKIQLSADLYLAEQYYRALDTVRERLQLRDEITLGMLTGAKDLITGKEEIEDIGPYWQEIEPVLKRSFMAMDEMRRTEGLSIANDIRERVDRIHQQIETIQRIFPASVEAHRDRLRGRLQSLLNGLEVDSARFQQEVAFLAERTDITEEIVRAKSHLAQFSALIEKGEAVGRKLDFLIQEIHREVNTASSKANDAEISQRVVEVKSELEKVREQVQNIE
jgi:uncharacterized protein (TIGR00255 family)